jgi:hypothetical protein
MSVTDLVFASRDRAGRPETGISGYDERFDAKAGVDIAETSRGVASAG